MPTPCWLKHLCSIRALVPMSFFLFLSLSPCLSFRLIPWSTEALWFHFPASKTLSRRCPAPSPYWEGAWGLCEQSKPHAGALLAVSVNQGISASFSPLLSYGWLRTTRFRSIKGPQQLVKPIVLPSLSSSIFFSHALIFPASTSLLNLPVSALLIEEERTLGSFIPFFILGTVFLWALFCALNI